MGVPATAEGNTFRYGNPRVLFEGSYVPETASSWDAHSYALSPDGQRFLMIKEDARRDGASGPPEIVVILNWGEELKRIGVGAVK